MLLWPICLWLSLFLPFLSGQIVLNKDSTSNYAFAKYFWNNVLNGVWPLWEPFVNFGRPFIAVTSGFLNPISSLIPIQVVFGADYYHAYLVYLAIYFITGCLGFYLLVKEIYKEEFIAFIAYILIMFSGFGPMLFNQVNILLLFVPAVWFFYCLMRFLTNPSKAALHGTVFWGMMIAVSYMPFYFATLLTIIIFLAVVLFFKYLKGFFSSFFSYFQRNGLNAFFVFFAIAIALLPLVLLKMNADSGTFISPARQECNIWSKDFDQCASGLQMTYELAGTGGTFAQRVGVRDLIGHLDKRHYGSDDFYYIPFAALLMIFFAAFTAINRVRLLILLTAAAIFIISMGNATPFYKVAYQCFPLFHCFRNLFFFMSFLIPLIILFAVGQAQAALQSARGITMFRAILPMSILIFAVVFLLRVSSDILLSTWVVLILGSLLAILYCLNMIDVRRGAGFILLMVVIIIEPIEVFTHFSERFSNLSCSLPASHVKPEFAFIRAERDKDEVNCSIYHGWCRGYEVFWYDMLLKDNLLLPNALPDYISRYFVRYLRATSSDASALLYLKHKVVVYATGDKLIILKTEGYRGSSVDTSALLTVEEKNIRAASFDMNSVSFDVDFKKERLFVYNDNYDKNWKAYIDGKSANIYRVNEAFKGVLVGPGHNRVLFVYEPFGGTLIMWAIFFFIYFYFGYCLYCWFKKEP